jgi:hypothetical protein
VKRPSFISGQHEQVALPAMLVDERPRGVRDRRHDPLPHELRVQHVELAGRERHERGQVELRELERLGLAALVARGEVAVGRLERRAVELALVEQEFRPLRVRVVRQQRVVEIEQRQDVGMHI